MAIYTEELHNLVRNMFDGDFNEMFPQYLLFDESHKEELQLKVYNYYKYLEIGFETEERFLHEFRSTWSNIIPLANNYYEVTLKPELKNLQNFIRNRRLVEDKKNHVESEVTDTNNIGKLQDTTDIDGKTTTERKSQFKDTPYTRYVDDSIYNTNVNDDNSTDIEDTTTTKTTEQLVDSIRTIGDIKDDNEDNTITEDETGLNGITYAEALSEYKKAIFDVDMWIISQLRELFMEVY